MRLTLRGNLHEDAHANVLKAHRPIEVDAAVAVVSEFWEVWRRFALIWRKFSRTLSGRLEHGQLTIAVELAFAAYWQQNLAFTHFVRAELAARALSW